MKLTFLPTLTDLREMLGERLYVEFVWMWRQQDQAARTQERRAKWAELTVPQSVGTWPEPAFVRAQQSAPPLRPEQIPAQVALHPSVQRLIDQKMLGGGQDGEREAVRARTAGYRTAAE